MAFPALELWLCTSDITDDGDGPSTHRAHITELQTDRSSDEAILVRLRSGDIDAFEVIYRTNIRSLIAFATSIVNDTDRARDVVADVFLDVWRTRAALSAPAGIRAYLYVAVRHRALNELRARGRAARWATEFSDTNAAVAMGEPPILPDRQLEGHERIGAVLRALDALPEPRRTICRLRFQEEMSFEEIGLAVGISANAVQQHLSRVRKLLRELLPSAFE